MGTVPIGTLILAALMIAVIIGAAGSGSKELEEAIREYKEPEPDLSDGVLKP